MRKQINFIFNNLKIFNMGENDEKDKPNAYGFMDRFRNAVLGAAMADQPAMMTASGWRLNEKGDYVLDLQNDPHVKLLRDNLAAEGAGVMLGEFGIPAAYGLYNLGVRGLGKAGSNWARAKLISKEMLNISPSTKEGLPLNVGWGPKQTIKDATHATDSLEPLQLFFDKRWDVTHEGANPFGVWYLGKWGLPRTAATNSLPGKAEKAARARKVFEDRKYKLTGEVTLDKPLTTVGEVPDRSVLSYDAEKMGADGIIYNNVYDNGYDNNQVILSHKLHVPSNKKGSKIHIKKKNRGKFTEYCGGEVTNECILKAKKSKNPTLRKRATFALNARGWAKKHLEGGPMEPSAYNRAVYSSINPLWGVPDNFFLAARLATQAKIKSMGDNLDKMDYEVGNSLGAKVADAGWRKRLGLEYEDLYLPVFNGDTVRLPKKLEMEIPTDTTMLKNRIAATERLMKRSSKYENSDAINLALKSDKRALEALRKTYATGLPVGIDEFSHNSRLLVKNGEIDENFITPLNVFRNYNIRYDKPTNRMYYSKSYDFDTVEHDWDKFVPGNPFYIRGYVDLNKKK